MLKTTIIKLVFLCLAGLLFVTLTGITSCKTGEGCGLEEKYAPDMESKKRGKTKLFKKGKKR